MDFFVLKTYSHPGRCIVRLCRKKAQKHRRFCRRCRQRRYIADNPVSYAYSKLKQHAKERKIAFELTPLEWECFCEATGYHELKGRNSWAMQVDRKDETGPYSLDNIQLLTTSENTAKGNRARHLPKEKQRYFFNQ